ncbi:MAG: hypothetical protein FJ225_10005 [Lentisphaerae bacterium]|nr:hypothetical protein [Lentisphaerota bacterium]
MKSLSHSLLSAALAALLLAAAAPCPAAPPRDISQLDAYRQSYERAVAAVLKACRAKEARWPEDYLKALAALSMKCQKDGDLDGVIAAKAEQERFAAEQKITPEVIAGAPEALAALQSEHLGLLRQCLTERCRRIIELHAAYDDGLRALEQKLTRDGKIEDALKVRKQAELAREDPEVTGSAFDLAAYEAEAQAGAAAPEEAPREQERPAGGAPQPAVAENFKVYSGKAPPGGPGYREVALRRTGNARLSNSASVRFLLGEEARDERRSRGMSVYSSHSTVSAELEYHHRVVAKMSNLKDALENPTIVVQSYAKPLSGSGRTDPQELGTLTAKIARLTGDLTIVDFAPLSASQYRNRYTSAYGSSSYNSGEEFYGAVVTVFDGNGEMAFQGASADSLKKLALTAVPDKPR